MGFEIIKCPICGKSFVPAALHSLTDGHGHKVCSPSCSTAAWKANSKNIIECEEIEHEKQCEVIIQRKQAEAVRRKQWVKAVDMLTKDGQFVKRFPSCTAAARECGFGVSTVTQICRGITKPRGYYTFKYADMKVNYPRQKQPFKWKPVLQYTKDGVFVKRYHSVTQAAKEVGSRTSNISACCNGGQHTVKGFIFRYEREDEKNENYT